MASDRNRIPPGRRRIPLGFIVNKLIRNAVKYGTRAIVVSPEAGRERGCALSVSNDGLIYRNARDQE
jgi:two-component sensor histidine kinase